MSENYEPEVLLFYVVMLSALVCLISITLTFVLYMLGVIK